MQVMKSIKKMLLGIASLLVSVISLVLYTSASTFFIIPFIISAAFGIYLCVDGYLSID